MVWLYTDNEPRVKTLKNSIVEGGEKFLEILRELSGCNRYVGLRISLNSLVHFLSFLESIDGFA